MTRPNLQPSNLCFNAYRSLSGSQLIKNEISSENVCMAARLGDNSMVPSYQLNQTNPHSAPLP